MANELVTLVENSGLEQSKAEILLSKFKDYFRMAAEIDAKATTIIVTDESQVEDMQMARELRLELREKRIDLEKTRKQLKEQSLQEGRTIDGIASTLKSLIVPIETYLGNQEKFAEIQQAKKEEIVRVRVQEQMEKERIAEEESLAKQVKKDREEQEKIRLDNERLRRERDEQELAQKKENDRVEAERKAERDAVEQERAKERQANQKIIDEQNRKQAELEEQLKNQIECPKCKHKFQIK